MRHILASLLVAGATFSPSAWAALKTGDALTTEALVKTEAIQGEAPKEWEPGKLYILECWATWCGPCVAAIPHVDGLYDKYKDKGLRVIGVNVMEEEKAPVVAFVKKKGEGMSYPVLFSGKEGSAFDTAWLKPGEVDGIPHAFIVKDGKFLFSSHPSEIDGEMIEGLLAGGEKQDAIVKSVAERAAKEGEVENLVMELTTAAESNDTATMEKKLAEIEKINPKAPFLPMLRTQLLIMKKDWPGFEKFLATLPDDESTIGGAAISVDEIDEVPESVRKALLARLLKLPREEDNGVLHLVISRYQWLTGDKEGAKANAQKAAKNPGDFPAKGFKDYAASLEAGKSKKLPEVFEGFEEEGEGGE